MITRRVNASHSGDAPVSALMDMVTGSEQRNYKSNLQLLHSTRRFWSQLALPLQETCLYIPCRNQIEHKINVFHIRGLRQKLVDEFNFVSYESNIVSRSSSVDQPIATGLLAEQV
jgi:hypothetical protein